MPELTIPMCARIIEILDIKDEDKILDYGCAKGFYVKAFRLLHKQCWGYDTSKYALSQVSASIKRFVSNDLKALGNFKIVIAKDVFEHIDYSKIDSILKEISEITEYLLCIIPLGYRGKYIVPAYELDKTHIIKESLSWWKKKLDKCGFNILSSEYNMKHIKQNYSQWKKGNGFIICKQRNENETYASSDSILQ